MLNLPIIENSFVAKIKYEDYKDSYDQELYNLGRSLDTGFIVLNPDLEDIDVREYIPNFRSDIIARIFVWPGIDLDGNVNEIWIAKYFPRFWKPKLGFDKVFIQTNLELTWRRNPEIDQRIEFGVDIRKPYIPNIWDSNYELVWYVDPKFTDGINDVWAFKARPVGKPVKGVKHMGLVSPSFTIERNKDIDEKIEFSNDYLMYPLSVWDFENQMIWYVDPAFTDERDIWIFKITPSNYKGVKDIGYVKPILPEINWQLHPALDNEIIFEQNIFNKFCPNIFKWNLEHVWYMDPRFTPPTQTVWCLKATINGFAKKDSLDVGYLTPKLTVTFNTEDIPKVNCDLDKLYPLYYDLDHEVVWYLDKKFKQSEELWLVKMSPSWKIVNEWRKYGEVEPKPIIKYHPDLPKDLSYNLNYVIPYYDFEYEHVWMLDPQHCENAIEPIWAFKIRYTPRTLRTKEVGSISPQIEYSYNTALPDLKFDLRYQIPYHDLAFKHVWHLDKKFSKGEKIWCLEAKAVQKTKGIKEMAYITPIIEDRLDVIFISYKEPNAEENWKRLLTKAPWAKRVHGIEGIFNAHKAAAKLAKSDMFYVVDGDAFIIDDWNFDFQPNIFEREYTHVWLSQNPFNDLNYGYGGVKLFSRKKVLSKKIWTTLDYTSSVNKDIKVINKVSNITVFNTSPFDTWRSAFRETIKLLAQKDTDKIDNWVVKEEIYFQFARQGVEEAKQFYQLYFNHKSKLKLINDYNFLSDKFFNNNDARH